MSEIAVALIGMGKMGRALAALAPERGFRVVAELDHEKKDYAGDHA
jgi:3-hydroxyisobutyrate dehydrogenase-like beta-hydroxyacid dehydrogenase